MRLKRNEIRLDKWMKEKIVYSIIFRRFNKVSFITGLLLVFLAIINIPLLYNPEEGEIAFNLVGKPVFGPGSVLNMYAFVGLFPAILGLIIMVYSKLSGKIFLLFINDEGKCQFLKNTAPRAIRKDHIEFSLTKGLQKISLGKRHHRFIIWAPIAGILFLIYLLFDHLNMLDPSFDVMVDYFDTQYSTKFFIWINIFYLIGIMFPITLFPRKLCKIDTSEEFLKFDYTKLQVEKSSELAEDLPYIKPFLILSKGQWIDELGKSIIPENYPDILKTQINKKDFKHLPLILLLTNIGLFLLVALPQLVPNFFLGSFTLRIEYFIMIAAFYFTVRTLHYYWYSNQSIEASNNNLIVNRNNRIFGNSVEYFANVEKIEQDFTPRKPHLLEYALFLLPFVEIVWWFSYVFTFPEYFFTENSYTILYFIVIIGIFLFTTTEYIFPRSILSITPKAQSETRNKKETYEIYFPSNEILKSFPLKEAKQKKQLLQNSLSGLMLILIPIIIGLVWVILSIYGILPHIADTVF